MNKADIINFFDKVASDWDAESIRNEKIISEILDIAGVSDGKKILDVACGTGFLFPDYYSRNVKSITGIDISEKMLNICSSKFPEAILICADAESHIFGELYDTIVIHNAFPHFCDPNNLLLNLTSHLSVGGRITVSHDMSRDELNSYHGKRAVEVSSVLPVAEKLASVMSEFVLVDKIIDNDKMYLVSGTK